MTRIEFFVPGIPKPAGSKRAFVNPKTGRAIITEACKKSKDWRADVQALVAKNMEGKELLAGPLYLSVRFQLPRPKHHYGTGKNADKLKDSAPYWHATKPDATKLLRGLEDALTGILWKDDCVISSQSVMKVYDDNPGAFVYVSGLGE